MLITKDRRAGQPRLLAIQGRTKVYTSVPVMMEMARLPRDKCHWEVGQTRTAIRHIAEIAEVVKPGVRLNMLADGPENGILECAGHAGAKFIGTGDRHLLKLACFEGIKIVSIAGFVAS